MDIFRRARIVKREYEAITSVRLDVANRSGNVTVRGHDRARVEVTARVGVQGGSEREADEAVAAVADGIDLDGTTLRVISPRQDAQTLGRPHGAFKIDYEIVVPFETNASIRNDNGLLDVQSIRGSLDAWVPNGKTTLVDVGGNVEVEIANGPLTISRCGGAVEARVSNGPVSVEGVQGAASVTCHNGPVDLRDVREGFGVDCTNGPVRYRGIVGGDIDIKVTNGPVELLLPEASRFELDAEAMNGTVSSDFAVHDAAPSAQPAHRVRLRAFMGGIHIARLTGVAV